ncbi:hypothetical protein PybrP1_011479 [[Pythium] brassicae (nom. inval.)]|nr:hypothetical protein PybrP1_011479 [[Pythium] brassicae (nom. inval.)]
MARATSAAASTHSTAPTPLLLHARYRVLHKLGDALYGAVWLCEDTAASNAFSKAAAPLVAVKQNILQFRHEFIEGGSWFVVMELCDSGDLLDVMQGADNARLSEPQVLALRF